MLIMWVALHDVRPSELRRLEAGRGGGLNPIVSLVGFFLPTLSRGPAIRVTGNAKCAILRYFIVVCN